MSLLKLTIIFTFSILLGLSACQVPVDTNDPASKEAGYVKSEGEVSLRSHYFEYQPTSLQGKRSEIILDIRKHSTFVNNELTSGNFDIKAIDLSTDKQLWNNKFEAQELAFEFGYIKASIPGVGQQEDTYRLFSTLTGKEVISYTNSEMRIGIPNTQDKRLVGFTSQNSANPLPREENLIGILTYASNHETIEKLKIKAVHKDTFALIQPFTPDMEFGDYDENNKVTNAGKGLILWNADENYTSKDVSNIVVILSFYYGEDYQSSKIYIPIENDRFNLDKVLHKEGMLTVEMVDF